MTHAVNRSDTQAAFDSSASSRLRRLNRREFLRQTLTAGSLLGLFTACSAPPQAPPPNPPAAPASPTVQTAPSNQTPPQAASPAAAASPAPAPPQASAVPLATAPAASAAQPGKRGGTLTIVRPIDSVALDPYRDITGPSAYVYSNILETLVKLDTDMQLKPALAERWETIAADRWRFYLRKGVKFHDGTDFNGQAVKFTVERIKNPQEPGLTATHLAAVKSVEVRDDLTVDIVTDGPVGPILRILSWCASGGIVSPTAVERLGKDFARSPVGTGPFKFAEWRTNTSITLERFNDYWGDKAYVDRAVFKVLPEESARMLALQTGEAQLVQVPAPSELPSLRQDRGFTIHEAPADRVLYFGFQTTRPPVDDPLVRRAMAYAFDPRPVLENVFEGAALPGASVISSVVFGFKDVSARFAYDPKRAEDLLDEAGWKKGPDGMRAKDGKPLVVKHLTPRGRYLKDAEASEAFQAAMRRVGIQVDLEVMEWGTLFAKIRQAGGADAEIFTLGWSTAIADADFGPRLMFHSDNIVPKGLNYSLYQNPKVDELTVRARASTDEKQRLDLYAEVQEILAQDMIALPVCTYRALAVSSAKVKGFQIHPNDFNFWVDRAWLDT